jgi:hypothetical protein
MSNPAHAQGLRQCCFRSRASCNGEVFPDWHKIGLEVGMQIRPEATGT